MEANFVIKAGDLTPDFASSICNLFSENAILHIKVEYESNIENSLIKKRAKKAGKPGPKPKEKATLKKVAAKRRGRRPKNAPVEG